MAVDLLHLGPNGLRAPGLRDTKIADNVRRALERSGGKATTYPIDHLAEHGGAHYFIRGMHDNFDPAAVIEVAKEGQVMAMAVLPGLGQVVGQMKKDMPLIWKLNMGGGAKVNGDDTTIRLYSNVEDAMKKAQDNGAVFWGATYYRGSLNAADMLRQLAEMDEAGAKVGLGGVVWNYPRGSGIPKGQDAFFLYQWDGFEDIVNACPGSLVFVKEKVSTLPGTVEQWEKGELAKVGHAKGALGKPGENPKDVDEDAIRALLKSDRAEQIRILVAWQHRFGIASLMSGGEPQKPEKFTADVRDGLGEDRHVALIAGRSTTRVIKVGPDGKYDITEAVAHFQRLNAAAPEVKVKA